MNNTILSILLILFALILVGCDETKGPAERAGENIDESIENSKDAISDAVEDAGDEVEDATDQY